MKDHRNIFKMRRPADCFPLFDVISTQVIIAQSSATKRRILKQYFGRRNRPKCYLDNPNANASDLCVIYRYLPHLSSTFNED